MSLGWKLVLVFIAFCSLMAGVMWMAFRERARSRTIAADDLEAQRAADGRVLTVIFASAIGGLALTLAWHRRLPSLAAGASVGAVVVALALGLSTGRPLPFVALVVAFGVFALWVAYHRDWTWLAWFPAVAADLAVASPYPNPRPIERAAIRSLLDDAWHGRRPA